jgi:hypothetical protein
MNRGAMRDGDWVHHNGPYEVFHALLYIPGKPPLNLMGDKMIGFIQALVEAF